MRKCKFSKHQIVTILSAVEADADQGRLRKLEISDPTYHQWKHIDHTVGLPASYAI